MEIWDDLDLIVAEIKKFPQTYATILKDKISNGTYQFILRRKLNNLFKEGSVSKTSIPGTRFGKAIYYVMPKEYTIIIESDRAGSNVYCCFVYEHHSKFHILMKECWKLENDKWLKLDNKIVFEGRILKIL